MKLTENFSFDEMVHTDHKEFKDQNDQEGLKFINPLTKVCDQLEIIRKQFGPVHVNDAFRCKPLNDAVGSSDASQHRLGEAVDFIVPEVDIDQVFNFAKDNCQYHQLAYEQRWIHLGIKKGFHDGQCFKLDPVTKVKTWLSGQPSEA